MRRRPGGRGARRGTRSVGPPSGLRRGAVEMERRPRRDKGSAAGGRGLRTRRVTDRSGTRAPESVTGGNRSVGSPGPLRPPAGRRRAPLCRPDGHSRKAGINYYERSGTSRDELLSTSVLHWTADRMCVGPCSTAVPID